MVPLALILAGLSHGAGGFYDARNNSTNGPRPRKGMSRETPDFLSHDGNCGTYRSVHEEAEMSTTIREALAGSRWSRVHDFMGKKLALLAIRLLVSVNLLYAAILLKFAGVPDCRS